jgi:hypothetical protein
LDLASNAAAVHAGLLAADTSSNCGATRVIPAEPDMSVLVLRLRGTCAGEAQSPFGGPYWTSSALEQQRLTDVELWIAGGAWP